MTEQEKLIKMLREYHLSRYQLNTRSGKSELLEVVREGINLELSLLENAKMFGISTYRMRSYCRDLGLKPKGFDKNKKKYPEEDFRKLILTNLIRMSCSGGKKTLPDDDSLKELVDYLAGLPSVCALTGVTLSYGGHRNDSLNRTVSIDRIDSSKGYILGNVRLVDKTVNMFIGNVPDELLYALSSSIVETKEKNDSISRSIKQTSPS